MTLLFIHNSIQFLILTSVCQACIGVDNKRKHYELRGNIMLGKLIDVVSDEIGKAVDDPIGYAVDTVKQPIVDAADVIDGLSEGDLRLKAAARLGADVVGGMAVAELVEWYQENN
jgi:hypothetical protein